MAQAPRSAWQQFLDATLYNASLNPLSGITKGMATTLEQSVDAWFEGKATLEYPEMKKEIADRFRGAHELLLEPGGGLICISCNLCAEACPIDCIEVTFQMDGKTRVLDQYNVDLSKCLFCDLCVEACPTYCIIMTKKFEYSDYSRWEDSALYLSREKGIERQASRAEFRTMVLRGYQPKYTELGDYFSDREIEVMAQPAASRDYEGTSFNRIEKLLIPENGQSFKPRKREEYKKPEPKAAPKPAAPAGPAVPMDYGEMGQERYEFWLNDERKASQLSPDERKEKGLFAKLKKANDESGASAFAATGGGAATAAAAPAGPWVPMDYGDLGKEKYLFWEADGRKASELAGEERQEKSLFMRLKRKNDEAGASHEPPAGVGGAAPVAAAPARDLDYGELGRERYEFWEADTRKASELSSEERKEKGLFMKIKRQNDAGE